MRVPSPFVKVGDGLSFCISAAVGCKHITAEEAWHTFNIGSWYERTEDS